MDNNSNFETYLLISNKKVLINVYDKQNSKSIYSDEKNDVNFHNELNLDLISILLEKNIFKIERLINGFVKHINLIVESNEFFPVDISIKKINYEHVLKKNDLIHLLNEVKQDCKNTLYGKKIIHMIINNYLIDDKKYFFFPDRLRSNHISIDVRLDCLSINYLNKIETVFKNYQIAIRRILNLNYVESFTNNKGDIFNMASNIIDGYNENEVMIVPKKTKIKGFFERFFNYFS